MENYKKLLEEKSEPVTEGHIWTAAQKAEESKKEAQYAARPTIFKLQVATWLCLSLASAAALISHDLTTAVLDLLLAIFAFWTIKDIRKTGQQ